MSIATELTNLAANRDAIKAAIEAKGVADAGDTLAEFPAAIASIPSVAAGNLRAIGQTSERFLPTTPKTILTRYTACSMR